MTREEKRLAELILNDRSFVFPSVEELNRELEEELSKTEPDMDLVNELIKFIQEYEGKVVRKPDVQKLISDISKTENRTEEQNIKVISPASKKLFVWIASACAAVIIVFGTNIFLSGRKNQGEPLNISVTKQETVPETTPFYNNTSFTEKSDVTFVSLSEIYVTEKEKTDSISTSAELSDTENILYSYSSQTDLPAESYTTVPSDIYTLSDNIFSETTSKETTTVSDTVSVTSLSETEAVTTFTELPPQIPEYLQPESIIRLISGENDLKVSVETPDKTAADMLAVTDNQKNNLIDYLKSEEFYSGVPSWKYVTENSDDWHISISYDNISLSVNENNDIVFSDGEVYYSFNIPGSYSTILDIFSEILGYPFPAYYMNNRYFTGSITCNGTELTRAECDLFKKIIKESSYYVLTPEQYEDRNSRYMKKYAPDREYIFRIKLNDEYSYVYELQYANSLKYTDTQNNHTYQGLEPDVFSKLTELGSQICDK